jgi:hypothetical protein
LGIESGGKEMKKERNGLRFHHFFRGKIIRLAACNLIGILMFASYSICFAEDASSKQVTYELQERCGITASQWAKQHSEVIDYQAHYNKKQNKCVVFATLAPIKSDDMYTSYYMVYEPNTNKTLAHYTVRNGPNYEDRICIIGDKNIGSVSEEKWNNIVKEFMEK